MILPASVGAIKPRLGGGDHAGGMRRNLLVNEKRAIIDGPGRAARIYDGGSARRAGREDGRSPPDAA